MIEIDTSKYIKLEAPQVKEVDLLEFGKAFAGMSSDLQGLFFRGLADGLHALGIVRAQFQMAVVADELTAQQAETLEDNLSMLWYADQR